MRSNVVFDSLYLDRCLRSSWYLDIVMLFLLGVISLMFRSDSVVFGLPGSCVWWWMICCHLILWFITYSMSYWGIFHFGRDLQIFTELHAYPNLWDVRWDDWLVHYFMMIPQWSLCGAIQPSPHFSVFDSCHVSYSERHSLDVWIWFGSWRSHAWW